MTGPSGDAAVDPLDSAGADAATMRGGALRVVAWTLGASLSLVSLPLLVRHLGVSEFGRYIAVISIVNIAALASDLGLTGLALREWSAARRDARASVMRTLLGLRLALAIAGALLAVTFALAAGYSGELVAGAAVAAVGLIAMVFGDFALVALAGHLRFGAVAAVEVTRSALGTLAIVVLVLADAGLLAFFAGFAVAAVLAAVLALTLARGSVPLRPRIRAREWRPYVADTAAYALAAVLHVVYFRAIMVIASLATTAREAGVFATGYRVIEFAAAIAGALAATATPVLSRAVADAGGALRRRALRTVVACSAAGVAGGLILLAGAPVAAEVIAGEESAGGAAVLRLLAPTVATTFAAFGMGAVLLVLRRYRALLTVNAVALATGLVAALILVPEEGAQGAALATVVGEVVLVVGQGIALLGALRGVGYDGSRGT